MKKIFCYLLSILFVSTISQTYAQSYYLTYCDGELASKASPIINDKATVGVATLFPEEILIPMKGSEIVSLRAGIISKLKISDFTLWISNSLSGSPLASGKIESSELVSGWNEIILDKPVEITGEPLYIGYTFTQPSKCNVISIYPSSNSYPFFLNDGSGWTDATSDFHGALCVEAGISGSNVAQYEIALNSIVPEDSRVESGGIAWLTVDFTNKGTNEIFSIDFDIETPENTYSYSKDFQGIRSREKGRILVRVPITEESGDIELTFHTKAINGNPCLSSSVANSVIEVVIPPYLRHRVLIEDFSNEFCVNCPSAAEKMDKVVSNPSYAGLLDVVVHHAGSSYDRFTVDASKEYECFYSKNKYSPMTMFNRIEFDGKRDFVPSSESEIISHIDAALTRDVNFSLAIDPSIDTSTGEIMLRAFGYKGAEALEGEVLLTVFLTENGIESSSQQGASGSYFHNNMLRSVSTVWGETVEFNHDGRFEKSVTLKYDPDKTIFDNCSIIAFISNGNENSSTFREVLQSASLPLAFASSAENLGVGEISKLSHDYHVICTGGRIIVEGNYAKFEVYNMNGLVVNPESILKGCYIVRIRDIEGNVESIKILL